MNSFPQTKNGGHLHSAADRIALKIEAGARTSGGKAADPILGSELNAE
jgi:hypothetical protein